MRGGQPCVPPAGGGGGPLYLLLRLLHEGGRVREAEPALQAGLYIPPDYIDFSPQISSFVLYLYPCFTSLYFPFYYFL